MIRIKDAFGDPLQKEKPDRRNGCARKHADKRKIGEKDKVRRRGCFQNIDNHLHRIVDDRSRDIDGKIAHAGDKKPHENDGKQK